MPEHPGSWIARIDNTSAGALVSDRHVITLAQCISNYTRWFGGYFSFAVQVLGEVIDVRKVEVEEVDHPHPLALLTLAEHNVTALTSVCVGDYREDFPVDSFSWETMEGPTVKRPITVYPHSLCDGHSDDIQHDLIICGSPEPIVCGSPLLQEHSERSVLVGLGIGEEYGISKYVNLSPAREWLDL